MTEQGIVKKVEGQLVWISGEQCAGCEREFHCGSCDSGEESSRQSGEFDQIDHLMQIGRALFPSRHQHDQAHR